MKIYRWNLWHFCFMIIHYHLQFKQITWLMLKLQHQSSLRRPAQRLIYSPTFFNSKPLKITGASRGHERRRKAVQFRLGRKTLPKKTKENDLILFHFSWCINANTQEQSSNVKCNKRLKFLIYGHFHCKNISFKEERDEAYFITVFCLKKETKPIFAHKTF